MIGAKVPRLKTPLPGPEAKRVLKLDAELVSPSFTRDYPLVAKSGRGAMVEDVNGNVFLDLGAGVAVVSTGHCHPDVIAAIQKQAAELIHMCEADFYYPHLVEFAQKITFIKIQNHSCCRDKREINGSRNACFFDEQTWTETKFQRRGKGKAIQNEYISRQFFCG